jgi:hypothetical protein
VGGGLFALTCSLRKCEIQEQGPVIAAAAGSWLLVLADVAGAWWSEVAAATRWSEKLG